MKKYFSLPALAVALLVFLGGCATYIPTDRASVSLVGVQTAQSTILETTIQLTVRVTNETNQPLHLQGSSHKFTLNGSVVGRGVNNAVLDVPPLGSLTIPLTIHLDNIKLFRQFARGQLPAEIAYRMDTRLFTPGSANGLPVLTEGTIDLRPFENALLVN